MYAGQTNILGGAGNDRFTVMSTTSGLHPESTRRVDFIAGPLNVQGQGGSNTIRVVDSGDDNPNTGTYRGATVSGLDMPPGGAITFASADVVEIRLGANDDVFYVPETSASVTARLMMGGGFDTVYIGTVAGAEGSGNLDAIQGDIRIEGQGPEADDSLFFNDQSNTLPKSFTVTNDPRVEDLLLQDGRTWHVDETTVSRGGGAVRYRTMESVVINAGLGGDVISIEATHREQAISGKNSTFSVNSGAGHDSIIVGSTLGGMTPFAIDVSDAPSPGSGIPLLVNGQAGIDSVEFNDGSSTVDTALAFAERKFDILLPGSGTLRIEDILELDLLVQRLGAGGGCAFELSLERLPCCCEGRADQFAAG